MINLKEKKLFLFDLDGVFYKGKENPIKIGGTRVITRLRETGKRIIILTNNSTDGREKIRRNLARLGIEVRKDEILTSSLLTAQYASEKYRRGSRYFLIGERGLENEMSRKGLVRTASANAKFVVIGLDRHLTYKKLDRAVELVLKGAEIVAAHKAKLYMYKNGPAVATGAIVTAVEYATSRKAKSIGKPSPVMFEYALKAAGCGKADAVMVGDQLDTDIEGANRAGIDSILVRTGVHGRAGGSVRPSATMENVDEIARYV